LFLNHEGQHPRQCVLSRDFAPHSFRFGHYVSPEFASDGKRKFWFNGGLIYQGPNAPADGSFPSLTVSLSSGTGWYCHAREFVRQYARASAPWLTEPGQRLDRRSLLDGHQR
jgi:hypothetical protein